MNNNNNNNNNNKQADEAARSKGFQQNKRNYSWRMEIMET
jgi:hypothetical protein